MTELIRSGQAGSLGEIDTTQGEFRNQIDTLTDMVRQLGGNAQVEPGPGTVNDPLSAPYVLYVNSFTGSDTFVAGDYADADDGSFEQKMRRISLQRLECGYTQARPFRTISRAIIEAGIITSRDYLDITPPPCGDLVSIVVSAGTHTVLNDSGAAVGDVATWADGYEPDYAALIQFNPQGVGGLILPRGVSVISLDLRKTILRPNVVPAPADDTVAARRCMFRMSGGGYYYGMTFMDQEGATQSHHLLSVFEYSSEAQLDDFYSKIRNAFGAVAGIDPAYAVTRNTEWQIVGNFPAADPPATSDTVTGSSPYIYNCSLRSTLGMCGLYARGDVNGGLSSTVLAQFTGVSLQTDMTCWQVYSAGTWSNLAAGDFDTYRDTDPDNVRMDPDRRSFHIRATENAVIQEVSVFAIGQGIHHWIESGAEISVTNSNSNFGGCASLAEGYQLASFPPDINHAVNRLIVADDMSGQTRNVKKISLGRVAAGVANNATTIELDDALQESVTMPGEPELLARNDYTLRPASLLWIENPTGPDYFGELTATAWDPANPDEIDIAAAVVNEDGENPDGTNRLPNIAGARVYIRRLTDTRSVDQRRYSILATNTDVDTRTPIRDYVLQTNVNDAAIDSEIPNTAIITVGRSADKSAVTPGVPRAAQVELRRNNANNTWQANTFYRKGDVLQQANKHWKANGDHTSGAAFDPNLWDQSYVHMEEGYRQEDFYKNAQPLIIFDNDTEQLENSTNLGWFQVGTDWNDNAELQEQYRTATDYKGLHSFLVSLGFTAGDADTILLPKPTDDRERDPSAPLDGIAAPGGAANSWSNWSIEFRRPSSLRLFAHAWEWSGYLNYTKALPKYQGELSASNRFTYYFTNQDGGRVYPSGYNEEGFAVTPRGLEDIETGEVLGPEDLGSGDQDINEQPPFNVAATTTTQGLVKIATDVQVQQALNGQAIDDDGDGFAFVLRVNELPQIRDEILDDVGILNDIDSDLYVATVIDDVPDADVESIGTETGDLRSVADRKAALYFADLSAAFAFIAGRSTASGRPITFHLYTATTTTDSIVYPGNSVLRFMSGVDRDTLSAAHTCAQIQINGSGDLQFWNSYLRFTTYGFDARQCQNFLVYGGHFCIDSTDEQYHQLAYVPQALVYLQMRIGNQDEATNSRDIIFTVNGSTTLQYGPEGIICRILAVDTRHAPSAPRPTLAFNCNHTGPADYTQMFRVARNTIWFASQEVDGLPTDYNFTINMAGSNISKLAIIGTWSYTSSPDYNISTLANNVFTNVTLPATIDRFSFVDAAGDRSSIFINTAANHDVAIVTAACVAAGAGLGANNGYYYRLGAGSVVNNVFSSSPQTLSVNGLNTFSMTEEEVLALKKPENLRP